MQKNKMKRVCMSGRFIDICSVKNDKFLNVQNKEISIHLALQMNDTYHMQTNRKIYFETLLLRYLYDQHRLKSSEHKDEFFKSPLNIENYHDFCFLLPLHMGI